MLNLGVLASGRGSNFQAIIDEIESGRLDAKIKILITDNPNAYAIQRAEKHNIKWIHVNPKDFSSKDTFYERLADILITAEVELVILAGFMRIIGKPLLDAYPMKVMNIHPALLPSFPGLHGQKKAIQYGVRISGCTVHFVDEGIDTGPIIIQAALCVNPEDNEQTLSDKILKLEHKIYPEAIRLYQQGRLRLEGRVVKIVDYIENGSFIINPDL
ncbi:MAG: phosphoribosylglycinamide formyltransferase [Thermodesulfovibrionales bacterium]